jgi:hypothetical protein
MAELVVTVKGGQVLRVISASLSFGRRREKDGAIHLIPSQYLRKEEKSNSAIQREE